MWRSPDLHSIFEIGKGGYPDDKYPVVAALFCYVFSEKIRETGIWR
jgi:hypothetical protein